MSHAPAEAKPGHNLGPIVPPSEERVLSSLKEQYPSVENDIKELFEAAKTYPPVIETDEQASALQALIKKMKTSRSSFKAWRGLEKKPWSTVANIVHNFFADPEEKLEKEEDRLNERLTVWSKKKAEDAQRAADEKARLEREDADRKIAEAAEKEMDALWAEARKELAEYNEHKARERAEEQTRLAKEAEDRRLATEAENRRLEAEKKAKDKAEREKNEDNLKQIRRLIKDATKLHDAAGEQGDETPEDDVRFLDSLIRPGGTISILWGRIANSTLLDDEQKAEIAEVRTKLDAMRSALLQRSDAKERRRQKKLREEEDRQAEADRLKRLEQQKADETAAEVRRLAKEQADRDAEEARKNAQEARSEVKTAIKTGNEAATEAKIAGREAVQAGRVAEKQESRAIRVETKAESLTDAEASRHRGMAGTTSSLAGRWYVDIVDYSLLPADKLWHLISDEAKSAAVTKFKNEHFHEWERREIVKDALPGVVFAWDPKTRTI